MTDSDFEIVHTYTREQAIEDGVLVETGTAIVPSVKGIAAVSVCITVNCYATAHLDDDGRRARVVELALAALFNKPDREDTPYMRLRVLKENLPAGCPTIWAILDGDGITVMLPEDY
ncbi:MAG: hypothetical protein WC457_02165 [Patescibacteria group bacterium]